MGTVTDVFGEGAAMEKARSPHQHYMSAALCVHGSSPVCVRAVLGNDHLQLAQPTHRCSVSASGELQKEALLLLTKRVQRLPKLPATETNISNG